MTTTYGLTDQGFLIPQLTDIRNDLNAALQTAFGASIDLGDKSILGQIVGILAERLALLWQLAQTVYNSQDPDAATGLALDALCALTGTTRPPAFPSVVVLTLTGTPATVVAANSIAAAASTGSQFETLADVTITLAASWAAATSYAIAARVTASGGIYQCTTAGTSSSSAPTSTDPTADIVDGTVHWQYVGPGTGVIDANAQSVLTGPITGAAGDITVRVTNIFGWNGVTNLNDAFVGQDTATDETLRTLRVEELSGDGTTTPDAIRAKLLEIVTAAGSVLSATVFVNNTDVTNGDGLPPHSIECLVRTSWAPDPTNDQIIVDTIYQNTAAGIATYSSAGTSGTSIDSEGNPQTVYFTRPQEVPIYVAITIAEEADEYPADGDTEIKNAIVAWGQGLAVGKDAVASAIAAQAFQVDGVLDTSPCYIGLASSPSTSTTIPISLRQLATYDSTRIVVTSAPVTP